MSVPGPEIIKKIFMLNSADKYKKISSNSVFPRSDKPRMFFSC